MFSNIECTWVFCKKKGERKNKKKFLSKKNKKEEMKLKVIFGKDIRLWHEPKENRYAELMLFVEKTFELKRNEYQLQYEDVEMDRITMSSEEDFEEALGCAMSQDRKSLKLFVVKVRKEEKKEQQRGRKEKKSVKK
ncbi:hypothetical protein RFI_11798, partial [Reticulomyxa filosa]